MTNDLRNYFESVGLQRPAEGELSRAIEATRAIKPRPAWQAQIVAVAHPLQWPLATGLRYAVLLALLLLALALLSVGFAGLGRPPSVPGSAPFDGRWRALDPDGSDLSLVVGPGASPQVRFEDSYASACANHGDSDTHWVSLGTGTVDGNEMSVHYPSGGGCTSWQIEGYFDVFSFNDEANTLTDQFGNVWRRPAPK